MPIFELRIGFAETRFVRFQVAFPRPYELPEKNKPSIINSIGNENIRNNRRVKEEKSIGTVPVVLGVLVLGTVLWAVAGNAGMPVPG